MIYSHKRKQWRELCVTTGGRQQRRERGVGWITTCIWYECHFLIRYHFLVISKTMHFYMLLYLYYSLYSFYFIFWNVALSGRCVINKKRKNNNKINERESETDHHVTIPCVTLPCDRLRYTGHEGHWRVMFGRVFAFKLCMFSLITSSCRCFVVCTT